MEKRRGRIRDFCESNRGQTLGFNPLLAQIHASHHLSELISAEHRLTPH